MAEAKAAAEPRVRTEIPAAFICPISQAIMEDPFIDGDGNSYEKECIEQWVSTHGVSPITRNRMSAQNLVPNRVLKGMIDDFRSTHDIVDTAGGQMAEAKSGPGSSGDRKHSSEKKARREVKEQALVGEEQLGRRPIVFFAVIDNSGSMCDSSGNNASGENDGYSRLDLVKHTLNTIVSSLSTRDKICIIKFSTVASVYVQMTMLTDSNKQAVMRKVNELDTEGQTNIWDGLRHAIDLISMLDARTTGEYNAEIFLLTDGEPNINPPRDIVDTVQEYMVEKCSDYMPKISTFGYGNRLKSKMLYDISRVCGGVFGFIPDSTMVGTVFINALSNTLVRSSESAVNNNSNSSSTSSESTTGSTTAGAAAAPKLSSLEEKDEKVIGSISRKFVNLVAELLSERGVPGHVDERNAEQMEELREMRAMGRKGAIKEFLLYLVDTLDCLEAELAAVDAVAGSRAIAFIQDLIKDCSDTTDPNLGQVMKAADVRFFPKWGMHYLFSVLSAFERRVCINFKDKAMQHFQSEEFKKEQKRIERVFVQLPPPTPSNMHRVYAQRAMNGGGSQAGPVRAPTSMSNYYDMSGGCFSADSLFLTPSRAPSPFQGTNLAPPRPLQIVDTSNGFVPIRAADLKKGMLVLSDKGVTSVECVVRFKIPVSSGLSPLFEVQMRDLRGGSDCKLTVPVQNACKNTLRMTAYHPLLANGTPFFAGECGERVPLSEREALDGFVLVYDVVLQNRGVLAAALLSSEGLLRPGNPVSINRTDAVYVATLGHKYTCDKFKHAYFGTEAVVKDLKSLDPAGWASGWVAPEKCVLLRRVEDTKIPNKSIDICRGEGGAVQCKNKDHVPTEHLVCGMEFL